MKKFKLISNLYYNYKCLKMKVLFISLIYLIIRPNKLFFKNNTNIVININHHYNKLIEENFFVFDSNNLEKVIPHMYGFSISKKGILTDNYYKEIIMKLLNLKEHS